MLGNLFRFSSEYYDNTLSLVYYNYRHYQSIIGRWGCRDLIEAEGSPFLAFRNNPSFYVDLYGLWAASVGFDFSASLLGGWTGGAGIAISHSKGRGFEFGGYIGTGPSAGPMSASAGIKIQLAKGGDSIDVFGGGSTSIGGGWAIPIPPSPVGIGGTIDRTFPLGEDGRPSETPSITSITLGIARPGPDVHVSTGQTQVKKWWELAPPKDNGKNTESERQGCNCTGCDDCICASSEGCTCNACKEDVK